MQTALTFFPAWRHVDLRRYLCGQLASVTGAWTQNISLNLLVYGISGSPALLGVLNLLLYGPTLLAGPIAGARVTFANAKWVTFALLTASLVNALLLFVLHTSGWLNINVLLILAAVSGLLTATELPARQVLVTVVSPAGIIGNAVSMNTLAFNIGRMVGPALAAVLTAHADAAYGFVANMVGISFMLLFCVARLHIHAPATPFAVKTPFWAGLAYVRENRVPRVLLPVLAGVSLFASGFQTLVPVLAGTAFGDPAAYTGVFFAASGGGALVAGVLLSSRHSTGVIRNTLMPAPWLAVLALLLAGSATSWLLACASFLLLGFALTICGSGVNAKLLQEAPPHLRGPLSGIYVMCFMGLFPVGQLLAGVLAETLPVRHVFLLLSLGLSLWLLVVLVLLAPARQRLR